MKSFQVSFRLHSGTCQQTIESNANEILENNIQVIKLFIDVNIN